MPTSQLSVFRISANLCAIEVNLCLIFFHVADVSPYVDREGQSSLILCRFMSKGSSCKPGDRFSSSARIWALLQHITSPTSCIYKNWLIIGTHLCPLRHEIMPLMFVPFSGPNSLPLLFCLKLISILTLNINFCPHFILERCLLLVHKRLRGSLH